MPKQSTHISIDSKNRVIITETFKDTSKLSRDVKAVTVGGVKRLRKIVASGTWSMTESHDLKFKVSGANPPQCG